MIQDPRRRRKIRVFRLASLATLLVASVTLLGFGLGTEIDLIPDSSDNCKTYKSKSPDAPNK